MAIDYGEQRLGLAVSDELGLLARPLATILRVPKPQSLARIKDYITNLAIDRVVVGLPLRLDGTAGDAVTKVNKFIALLKANLPCPIVTWDERLTSFEAEERMREAGLRAPERKARIDQFAAMIILEDYLANNPSESLC